MPRYKIAGAHIAHQNIDGEIILVDLKLGAYYSIGGGGSAIWNHLSNGATLDQTIENLSLAYSTDKSEIGKSAQDLLEYIVRESLVIEATDDDTFTPLTAQAEVTETERSPLAPVQIEKFDDLSDALMYDPIHDFDQETGWPNMPGNAAAAVEKSALNATA